MGRREEKKEETRERLREAAFALFERRGYETTKVEDVARAAGVSPRTVYRYFPTKAELVFFDMPGLLEELVALVMARPAAEPPFVAVRNAWVKFAPIFDTPTNADRVRIAESNPTLYRRSLEVRDDWADALGEALVRRGGRGPNQTQRRLLGHVALAAALWAVRTWRDEEGDRRDLCRHMARTLDSLPRLVRMSE
jgi:AcrR family transcriptional regulator